VLSGYLSESRLDEIVAEFVEVVLRVHENRRPEHACDMDEHHALARRVASESIVLLKNESYVLPLDIGQINRVALIGLFAKEPRYQGAGSSQVTPPRIDNAYEAFSKVGGVQLDFVPGYLMDGTTSEGLLSDAKQIAVNADAAIVFVGLPDSYEIEGVDRSTIELPNGHNRLVDAVSSVQPRTVVVLSSGSAVAMPWADRVPAIIESWLGGQAGAGAVIDVITGRENPSGKLSETFPIRLEDTPAYPHFPGRDGKSQYGEGIFTGYRHYDTKKIDPLFSFGHGLSYTTFSYLDLRADSTSIKDDDGARVHVVVKNTGGRSGCEVVQLYVREHASRVPRPEKELRRFAKVFLEPGEERTVTFNLSRRDFAHWDVRISDWAVGPGRYDILAGGSSRNLPVSLTLEVSPSRKVSPLLTRESLLQEFFERPQTKRFVEVIEQTMLERLGLALNDSGSSERDREFEKNQELMRNMIRETPASRMLVWRDALSEETLEEMIDCANAQLGTDED
jgi:beta-glucosidase